jgi:hypothetical protein
VADFPKVFSIKPMSSIYYVKNGVTSFYYIGSEYETLINILKNRLTNDKKFAGWLTKYIYAQYNMYANYADKLNVTKDNLNSKKVFKLIDKHRQIEEKMSMPFWIIFNTVERIITDLLVSNGVSDLDLKVLALTERITPLDQYRLDLHKSVLTKNKNSLNNLTNKYAHLGVFDFMFQPKDITYHSNQIKDISKSEAMFKIKEIQKKIWLK